MGYAVNMKNKLIKIFWGLLVIIITGCFSHAFASDYKYKILDPRYNSSINNYNYDEDTGILTEKESQGKKHPYRRNVVLFSVVIFGLLGYRTVIVLKKVDRGEEEDMEGFRFADEFFAMKKVRPVYENIKEFASDFVEVIEMIYNAFVIAIEQTENDPVKIEKRAKKRELKEQRKQKAKEEREAKKIQIEQRVKKSREEKEKIRLQREQEAQEAREEKEAIRLQREQEAQEAREEKEAQKELKKQKAIEEKETKRIQREQVIQLAKKTLTEKLSLSAQYKNAKKAKKSDSKAPHVQSHVHNMPAKKSVRPAIPSPIIVTRPAVRKNPTLIASSQLTGNKGFCVVEFENKYSLVGYIGERIFILDKLSNLSSNEIKAKLYKSHNHTDRYIIHVGNYKALVDVNEENMQLLLEV